MTILFAIIFVLLFGSSVHCIENLTFSEHGIYSQEYLDNWSDLPTGKEYIRKSESDYLYSNGFGEDLQKKYFNKKLVYIRDIALQINWAKPYDKYHNTLFLVRGCEKVIIDNVAIIQLDSDYRASHSIFIEDCKEVIIKNSFFSGTNNNYHIRVEGCEKVFIDNIEISGFDYGANGVRCGGGILINNGDPKAGGYHGMVSPAPKDMKWCVIQNCYIHDNLASDKWRNQDGILIQSAADGIVFNCYFENWEHGDGALDISHRRADSIYHDHFFRIERNVFKNCKAIKTPGNSGLRCTLFFTNNLYINTSIVDYHKAWDLFHIHETFIFNKEKRAPYFYKLWDVKRCLIYFINNLLFVNKESL